MKLYLLCINNCAFQLAKVLKLMFKSLTNGISVFVFKIVLCVMHNNCD